MDANNAQSTPSPTILPERIEWIHPSGDKSGKATAAAKSVKPRSEAKSSVIAKAGTASKSSTEAKARSRPRVAPPSRGVSKALSRSARRRRAKQMTKKVVDISDMLLGMNI